MTTHGEIFSNQKIFSKLIKSNRNQIVFAIFRLIRNSKRTCPFDVPNKSEKMVNTIWFQFDLIRFRKYFLIRKDFSVCSHASESRGLITILQNIPNGNIFSFWKGIHFSWKKNHQSSRQPLGKSFSHSKQIGRNTIVVTVFRLVISPRDFRWVHNQKENCLYDRIRSDLKGFRTKILQVYVVVIIC